MSTSPFAVSNKDNNNILLMVAAALQAPGIEGTVLGLPVMLWGAPGVGKTSQVNKMLKALGFVPKGEDPITVLASVRGASDFLGIPVPGAYMKIEGNKALPAEKTDKGAFPVLSFAPPDWAIEAKARALGGKPLDPTSPRAAVFFDEFTTAQDDVQAAMLRVIHERVVGDLPLPPNVVVVAAANPPSMAPGGSNLSEPVANRFIHLFWKPPSVDQWANWISATEALSTTAADKQAWPKLNMGEFYRQYSRYAYAMASWVRTAKGGQYLFKMTDSKTAAKIRTFYKNNPDLDRGTPKGVDQPTLFTDQYAWPSPRSLELAVRGRAAVLSLEGVENVDRIKLADQIVCGTIGSEACASFNAHNASIEAQTVLPADYIASATARAAFLKANPPAEVCGAQLQSVIDYYRELPLTQMQAQVNGMRASLQSFGKSSLDSAMLKGILFGYKNWQGSDDGGKRVIGSAPPRNRQEVIGLIRLVMAELISLTKKVRDEALHGARQGQDR